MFYAIIKVLITAIIIIVASEIAKEKSLLAGLIISMPTVTVLALIWLYWDTHDIQQVKNMKNLYFPKFLGQLANPVQSVIQVQSSLTKIIKGPGIN